MGWYDTAASLISSGEADGVIEWARDVDDEGATSGELRRHCGEVGGDAPPLTRGRFVRASCVSGDSLGGSNVENRLAIGFEGRLILLRAMPLGLLRLREPSSSPSRLSSRSKSSLLGESIMPVCPAGDLGWPYMPPQPLRAPAERHRNTSEYASATQLPANVMRSQFRAEL
jgi:hypothetical protein